MSDGNGWSQWVRNGRLSAVVWGLTLAAWFGLKVTGVPVEGLDTVLIVMSGSLAANLGITTVKPAARSQRDADKVGETNGG